MADEGIPEPDAVLCQVGTEIYLQPLAHDSKPLATWHELLLRDYDRDEAESFFAGIAGLKMQPAECSTRIKTSCFLDRCDDPERAAAEIGRRVAPHANRYQVIWSSGRGLDYPAGCERQGQSAAICR